MKYSSPSFEVNNRKTIDQKYGPLNHPTRNRATPGDYEKYMSNHVFDRSFIENNDKEKSSTIFGKVALFFIVILCVALPHMLSNFIASEHIEVNSYMAAVLALVLFSVVIAFPYHYVRKKIEDSSKQ